MALNRILLHGRLVKDVELRTIGDDVKVASFRIAVDRDRLNKNGEREADFIDITAWRGKAEFVAKYFGKGDSIIVDGRLQGDGWTAEDGSKRYSLTVVADNLYFGAPKGSGADNASEAPAADDSELPF